MADYDLNVPGSWQAHCTKAFSECLQHGPRLGATLWFEKKKELERVQRVILADADFGGRDLRGFSFHRTYLIRLSFARTDLQGVDFRQAIVRQVDLTEADISGANFKLADLDVDVVMLSVTYDRDTDFAVGRGKFPGQIDISLKEVAENEWRKADLLRNRSFAGLYKLLVYLTDYGESFWRLFSRATSELDQASSAYIAALLAAPRPLRPPVAWAERIERRRTYGERVYRKLERKLRAGSATSGDIKIGNRPPVGASAG